MICWWWVQDEAGREGKAVWSLQFETAISHNECLKSEKAAGAFSGIASKRLLAVFFFFFPHLFPLISCPFFLSGLSRCCAISELTQESMSRVHRRPFEKGSHFAAHLGKHLPSSSVFLAEMKGVPERRAGFVTKATCWARQPVVGQERSLWWTQVLGCPLACLSVSVALPTGHLYNCNITHAKTKGRVGSYKGRLYRQCLCMCLLCNISLNGAECPLLFDGETTSLCLKRISQEVRVYF